MPTICKVNFTSKTCAFVAFNLVDLLNKMFPRMWNTHMTNGIRVDGPIKFSFVDSNCHDLVGHIRSGENLFSLHLVQYLMFNF